MEIADGEFVSLLGPSGCGKTTTLKLIAGFEEASGGAIRFDGRDVVHVPVERRDIGMVFQNYALFPHMTVAENLAFGLEMRKVAKPRMRERIAEVLDMVQLAGFGGRYPRQLSGGQQQRVALARALVIEPAILLLDEPLANLDAKLREEMRVFIRELQRRVGITTLYVTHDQAEAMTMSDRVVVMLGGRIAQIGPPSEIYERPATRAVAEFVGQVNILDATVVASDATHCTLDTGFGPIDIGTPYPVGTAITLALRPEAVELHAPDAAGGFRAVVLSAIYSGSHIDYRVRLDSGETIHAQALPRTRFDVGDRLRVDVTPGSLWPLGPA